MIDWWLIVAMVLLALLMAVLFWQSMHSFGREIQISRARELFALQRERLEVQFLKAAAATGKPRGLRWKRCAFEEALELARDRNNGQIVGLVPVTIQFEAIEGSDMEGLPAVGNLRYASAVFFFERGQWQTVGKAVFNMSPGEALDHFHQHYERIELESG